MVEANRTHYERNIDGCLDSARSIMNSNGSLQYRKDEIKRILGVARGTYKAVDTAFISGRATKSDVDSVHKKLQNLESVSSDWRAAV